LSIIEALERDRRHFAHAHRLCREQPPVAGNDVPSGSMRMGLANPNALIDPAICSICRLGCVLALRASGIRLAVGL
jgi:hypothetical protein